MSKSREFVIPLCCDREPRVAIITRERIASMSRDEDIVVVEKDGVALEGRPEYGVEIKCTVCGRRGYTGLSNSTRTMGADLARANYFWKNPDENDR